MGKQSNSSKKSRCDRKLTPMHVHAFTCVACACIYALVLATGTAVVICIVLNCVQYAGASASKNGFKAVNWEVRHVDMLYMGWVSVRRNTIASARARAPRASLILSARARVCTRRCLYCVVHAYIHMHELFFHVCRPWNLPIHSSRCLRRTSYHVHLST